MLMTSKDSLKSCIDRSSQHSDNQSGALALSLLPFAAGCRDCELTA